MGRKPKVLAAPVDREMTSVADLDAPVRPDVKLRRSSRQSMQNLQGEAETREIQGKVLGIRPDGDEKDVDPNALEDRAKMNREGVQLAIEGLARMERRLQRATRRQKLKVEETHFSIKHDAGSKDTSLQPESAKEAILQKSRFGGCKDEKHSLPTPDKDSFEQDAEGRTEVVPVSDVASPPEDSQEAPERGAARPPPVNSSFLPLPWKGRLGYACLNTYLRTARPPVFSSRTCRMASIVEHRHPLKDPSQPEHPVKNRPDKSKPAQRESGIKFVQGLGLANARDIPKMLRWNDKYGIKFMRLSSEMFPFASHPEHGYRLAPFASEVLAEAGRVAAELDHRLTTHPGQFTQLGSPRTEVVDSAIRDLDYHDEMLSLLRLPEQQNRDAVMIIHMGGTYGDKPATLARFRQNYARLSPSVRARLVLENDDVGWSVHDLLPLCEDLNIPLVLDYHHHNIIFDATQCREGTYDISQPAIMDRIAATWKRKGIRQKMHYSEPCAGAVTPRDRRKHSPRVATLPPCPPDMDLMIEAKDKEQAVFELMRNFKLPGYERIKDMIPHERADENRAPPAGRGAGNGTKKKPTGGTLKRKRAPDEDPMDLNDVGAGSDDRVDDRSGRPAVVPEEELNMGGPDGRVYWPPGHEEWLRPRKRETKKRNVEEEDDDEDDL